MSKRFIDTELFDDEWFMELSKDSKLLWLYMITKCDHAGIISLNKRLVQFQTGIKYLDKCIKELSNRLVTVSEVLYFIPKYIDFQYPNFPNSRVKQQESAINILIKNGLYDEKKLTVKQVLPNAYDNDSVIENESIAEKKFFKYNEFYDSEIDKSEWDVYKIFVDFLFGNNDKEKPFSQVLKMSDQITPNNLKTLMGKYSKELIKEKVFAMDNQVGLLKKYTSFYSTLDGWCAREGKR